MKKIVSAVIAVLYFSSIALAQMPISSGMHTRVKLFDKGLNMSAKIFDKEIVSFLSGLRHDRLSEFKVLQYSPLVVDITYASGKRISIADTYIDFVGEEGHVMGRSQLECFGYALLCIAYIALGANICGISDTGEILCPDIVNRVMMVTSIPVLLFFIYLSFPYNDFCPWYGY